jgi:hypothetical protein
MIDKDSILIDPDYQSTVNEKKAARITKDFYWPSFGTLSVAFRASTGEYYAFDGQHRGIGAKNRPEVIKVPCMVFNFDDITNEAEAWWLNNVMRNSPSAVDKFHNRLAVGDPAAVLCQSLCVSTNRTIASAGGGRQVQCIAQMMMWANEKPVELEFLWPLISLLSGNDPVHIRILSGLMYIESHLPYGVSLTQTKWRKKLHFVGVSGLLSEIVRAIEYEGGGGRQVWAQGIVKALNKKVQKNRLKLVV